MRLTALILISAGLSASLLASPLRAQTSTYQPNNYQAENEIRLMEMENQLRRMTGQYEEAMYRLTQMNRRLERTLEDMEYRLDQLEQQAASQTVAAPVVADGEAPVDTSGAQVASDTPDGSAERMIYRVDDPVNDQAPEQMTGQDPTAPAGAPAVVNAPSGGEAPTPETAPEQFLQGDTPEAQFNNAFALLRRNELEPAEFSFRAFLVQHAGHPLTSNAKYWLGKTYYARGDYAAAARVFLEGFEQFAETDKGPDTLLHLALSLNQLGQQDDACAAFGEIASRYPNADPTIAQRAASGRQVAGCS